MKNYGRESYNGACLPCRPPARATTIPWSPKGLRGKILQICTSGELTPKITPAGCLSIIDYFRIHVIHSISIAYRVESSGTVFCLWLNKVLDNDNKYHICNRLLTLADTLLSHRWRMGPWISLSQSQQFFLVSFISYHSFSAIMYCYSSSFISPPHSQFLSLSPHIRLH